MDIDCNDCVWFSLHVGVCVCSRLPLIRKVFITQVLYHVSLIILFGLVALVALGLLECIITFEVVVSIIAISSLGGGSELSVLL